MMQWEVSKLWPASFVKLIYFFIDFKNIEVSCNAFYGFKVREAKKGCQPLYSLFQVKACLQTVVGIALKLKFKCKAKTHNDRD